MKSLLRNSIYLLLLIWITTACDKQTLYYSYQSIPSSEWTKSDTLFFNVPITDSLVFLHLSAEVRNNNYYPYRNLYLIISHNLEDSTTWQTDTLKYMLANEEGKWNGEGWNSLYHSSLPLKTAVPRHPGNYTFKIIHGMKDEKLLGINDIGIKISN